MHASRCKPRLRQFLLTLNPVMKLTRTPNFEVPTATLKGTWSAPVFIVTPAARTSPTPSGVMLGPIPNSLPPAVRRPTSQLSDGRATPYSSSCARSESAGCQRTIEKPRSEPSFARSASMPVRRSQSLGACLNLPTAQWADGAGPRTSHRQGAAISGPDLRRRCGGDTQREAARREGQAYISRNSVGEGREFRDCLGRLSTTAKVLSRRRTVSLIASWSYHPQVASCCPRKCLIALTPVLEANERQCALTHAVFTPPQISY